MTVTATTWAPDAETLDGRRAFADELRALAREDARVVAVCNDSVGSSNLGGFAEEFPDRLVNVGIAEQDMVGVGAGLANAGFVPFVSAAGPFISGRATEQVKADVAYSGFHVVLCAQSPGMAYGELGPTHHSVEDLSWMRAIADLPVVVPADSYQTRQAVRWAAAYGKGSYLRIPRFAVPEVTAPGTPFELGRAITLRQGEDVTLIAAGTGVSRSLEAAEILAREGISARVVNMPFIDPIDEQAVVAAATETRGIVTVEEATITGGLGAAVSMVVAEQAPTRMRFVGVRGFAPTGHAPWLLAHFGISGDGVAAAARELAAR